jgi:Mg-chelatase subunit ChlD/Arc/MetJ-type ribon-helix-helix transcriptional regulator
MYQQTTNHPLVSVELTAHEDATTRILFASIKAEDREISRPPSHKVALVVDRSGSMSGEKLEISKRACAKFLRSLDAEDQVAVITYDDNVDVVTLLARASEDFARKVERIQSGGSTNLYGGWVLGAKMVGQGGKVVLLSDGLANVGRYTRAGDLERHAGISYQKFGVATTTIGVGLDYDEALMAGMARAGGGGHYFAKTADKIMEAFSQERMASMNTSLVFVSLRYGSVTKELGAIAIGETRTIAIPIERLAGPPATLRFTDYETGKTETIELAMPADFGYSEEAALQALVQEVADAEDRATTVVDPEGARSMSEFIRALILKLLGHRLAEDPIVQALINQLEDRKLALEQLSVRFVHEDAMMYRKQSMQGSHNLRAPMSAWEGDNVSDRAAYAMNTRSRGDRDSITGVALDLFQRAKPEDWIRWKALPVFVAGGQERLAMSDPKDGFLLKEIQVATNMRVRCIPYPVDERELDLWRNSATSKP